MRTIFDKLQQALTDAMKQVPSEDYYTHTEPGVSGTDPFGSLAKGDLTSVASAILGSLASKGVAQQQVAQQTGLPTNIDPRHMTPDQIASIVQWLQQSHPEVLGQVAAQHQDQPDIVHALLGNKALMLALAAAGAGYMSQHYEPGLGGRLTKKQ